MSINSSSLSNSSHDSVLHLCPDSRVSILIGTAFSVTRAFLLFPLSILILFLGHQRWRQQRSFSTTSHSDIFTYHVAALELICCLGSAFYFWGSSPEMNTAGYWLVSMTLCGEGSFHLLACVERYLAVVHPVIYLGLRKAGGVRIRNISIGCVWLLCIGWSGFIALQNETIYIAAFFSLLAVSLPIISFCSLSALRVLIRPGPGEVGRERERVDQSKQRAFLTVMAITGVQWLWFVGLLVSIALDASPLLSFSVGCLVKVSAFWCNLPCSLVLPLLYLHRAGKLPGCKHNTVSGE